ncbi:MAG TPA: Dyp-type peroxidase [Chloroflexia bacterium]|jgi:Dyp-type peroxidase family
MLKMEARESPVNSITTGKLDPSRPKVPGEPVLDVKNIQGNSIAGFMKDHQMFLFLKIVDVKQFKAWLASTVDFIATAEEVLAFNKLFKMLRTRRGESSAVKSTWVNIAFSHHGLMLLDKKEASKFTDNAFKAGLAARSEGLGDPKAPNAEGNQRNWVVGGTNYEADVIVLVASDDLEDLYDEVNRIEESIYGVRRTNGTPARSGAQIIYKQQGANLPGTLSGHEHFGFLDGVSQPGLRGRVSDAPDDVLTLRQNPEDENQGKPGQDLIWPGEFVFGYPGQTDKGKSINPPGDVHNAGPSWGKDGSFLVFRRLRQDVPGFHRFVNQQAGILGNAANMNVEPAFLGAKLVGRWPSGAPIMRSKKVDVRPLGQNDCANNNFEFRTEPGPDEEPPDRIDPNASQCALPRIFPPSTGDNPAEVCPYAGHIRKAYPRNDEFDGDPHSRLNEVTTQTHRLLRRGIPFGPVAQSSLEAPGSPDEADGGDAGQRGLLFFAYMTSIEDQFEFVTKSWVNNPDFKEAGKSGYDLILGQNNTVANRERTFHLKLTKDHTVTDHVLTTTTDWVIPTGGGYFFSPSIDAMKNHLAK